MPIPPCSRITRLSLLLPLAFAAVLPLGADDDRKGDDHAKVTVLYDGPLLHDQNWTIKSGPVSPDNQKNPSFGGTCSMVPNDVSIQTGSGRDRVTFEAEYTGLGVWKMAWMETVSGGASNGDEWHYQQRVEFSGTTTDGKAPRPNRSLPSPGNDGFLQAIPSNVSADTLDLDRFLHPATAGWRYRGKFTRPLCSSPADSTGGDGPPARLLPGCCVWEVHRQPARSACRTIRM